MVEASAARTAELVSYARLARLDLPLFNKHPARHMDFDAELTFDETPGVLYNRHYRDYAFEVIQKFYVEFLQDPAWEVKLVARALRLAKERGFTEVAFYDAYCIQILQSGRSIYTNSLDVATLMREGRLTNTLRIVKQVKAVIHASS